MANYQSTYTGTQIDEAIGKANTAVQGSTGSADNALLRADGTGGGTVQSSTAALSDTGNLTIGGGTETTSQPVVDATQTWNASGTTFTGIKFNVTDTASASGSLLMDLRVGGASKFKVTKNGNVEIVQTGAPSTSNLILKLLSADRDRGLGFFSDNYGTYLKDQSWGSSLYLGSTVELASANNVSLKGAFISIAADDVRFYRDAAQTLAQRNGTNAQTFRVYGTYTDASNYRRLTQTMSTGGVAQIKPEGAGTGASGNVLHISGLPTSNPGAGILWIDTDGIVKVGT